MSHKPGPKRTKPDRKGEFYRINMTSISRMNRLVDIRKKNDPRFSISDAVNEAIELLLDMEGIPVETKEISFEL